MGLTDNHSFFSICYRLTFYRYKADIFVQAFKTKRDGSKEKTKTKCLNNFTIFPARISPDSVIQLEELMLGRGSRQHRASH